MMTASQINTPPVFNEEDYLNWKNDLEVWMGPVVYLMLTQGV